MDNLHGFSEWAEKIGLSEDDPGFGMMACAWIGARKECIVETSAEWKPIETLPNDALEIVAFDGDRCFLNWLYDAWWDDDNGINRKPTHWLCQVPEKSPNTAS